MIFFEEESQNQETKVFAVRWRLEPKSAEDAQKQEGEVIEPLLFITLIPLLQKNGKIIKQGIDDWRCLRKCWMEKMRFVVSIGQKMIQQ
jgi:hypothetical protein